MRVVHWYNPNPLTWRGVGWYVSVVGELGTYGPWPTETEAKQVAEDVWEDLRDVEGL